MNYEPLKPSETLLFAEITFGEAGQPPIQGGHITEETLERIQPPQRQRVISSLMVWRAVLKQPDLQKLAASLGYPVEASFSAITDSPNNENEEVTAQIEHSLVRYKALWPFDYHQAVQAIPNEEAALLCLGFSPTNQAVSAFCPVGSKGFVRTVQIATQNNPASPEPVKVKPRARRLPNTPEGLLGFIIESAQSAISAPQPIKDVEFPES